MNKYTVLGYYEYVCFDKVYIEVEANSPEEALKLAKTNPNKYEMDYKNIDVSDSEYQMKEDWKVIDEL